jgi:hypothetical protein
MRQGTTNKQKNNIDLESDDEQFDNMDTKV